VKKTTINAILMGIIVLLSISVCLLLFAIVKRPRYSSTVTATPEPAVITEASEEEILSSESEIDTDGIVALSDSSNSTDSTQKGKTSTKVNIRDNASTDAKVLATVEGGTTFDIIEVQSDGWTKILYNGSTAYISSDYVILINE
jgi:uncharacterized glyoxalase superfamily protein PhnB